MAPLCFPDHARPEEMWLVLKLRQRRVSLLLFPISGDRGHAHCATGPAVRFLGWDHPRMVGAARASLGVRDGQRAQPRPSSLQGSGLPCVAGPSVPSCRGVTWATLCQPGCLKAGTCTWCRKAGEGREAALGRWLPPEPPPLCGDGGDCCRMDRPWHQVCVHPLGQTTQVAGLRAVCRSVLTVTWRLLAGLVLVPLGVWDHGWE